MKAPTRTELDKAIKKTEIAIDKMIDIQDMGLGNLAVQDVLDKLNSLARKLYNTRAR